MSITVSVPRRRCDTASDRMTSSVMTPPALRSTCASPYCSPSAANTSSRESMHVTTAIRRRGWTSRCTASSDAANRTLLATSSSITSPPLASVNLHPYHPHMVPERPPRVLVVEDDEEIAQVLQRSLRMEGYEVRTSADGEAALADADAFSPDLVILDLGLPKLVGIDVARALRADGDVPILMLTARDAVDAR